MVQQILEGDTIRATPFELTAVGAIVGPNRHTDVVLDKILQQTMNAAVPLKLIEQQVEHTLYLLIGVQGKRAGRQLDVAGGRMIEHLAASGFVQQALIHPRA